MTSDSGKCSISERFFHLPPLSVVNSLIIINVVVFLSDFLLKFFLGVDVDGLFALSLEGLKRGFLWQCVTFQFLHANFFHIFCNLLSLYFIGPWLERTIGSREFLKLYLLSGTVGGLLQIACGWILPEHFGHVGVVGASAGVFGVVTGFATLFPQKKLTMLILVFPVTIKARTLIMLSVAIAVLGMFSKGGNIAHAAHLGGILTAVFYILRIASFPKTNSSDFVYSWTHPLRSFKIMGGKPEQDPVAEDVPPLPKEEDVHVENPKEFMEKKVNPVLDKISRDGFSNLTDEERKILEIAAKLK